MNPDIEMPCTKCGNKFVFYLKSPQKNAKELADILEKILMLSPDDRVKADIWIPIYEQAMNILQKARGI